jgi:hypothetical protein
MSEDWADDQVVGGAVPPQFVHCIAELWPTRHGRNPNGVGAAVGLYDVVSSEYKMSAIAFEFGPGQNPVVKIAWLCIVGQLGRTGIVGVYQHVGQIVSILVKHFGSYDYWADSDVKTDQLPASFPCRRGFPTVSSVDLQGGEVFKDVGKGLETWDWHQ